jgi:PAS domain S-box-containing protein
VDTALIDLIKRLGAGDMSARAELQQHPGELARTLDGIVAELENRATQLAEAESQFHALIEQSLVGIYLTTYDRFVYLNEAALEILGYAADELLGRRGPLDLVHPGDRAVVARHLQRRISGKLDAVRYSLRMVRKDGATIHLDVHGRRVLSGGRPAVLGVAVDVTERRRNRQELQRQREALLRSERLATIGELLGGVAHELNNPLTVILGQASLLTQMVPDGPVAERARRIQDAAERAARIVQTFLAVVRDTPLERTEVSLNQVVREATQLLGYQLRVATIKVVLDLSDALPVVWGDAHQLHQVVVNLLTNAYQAVRGSAPPRRIRLSTAFDAERARVVLEVADTGPGIPAAICLRIFEPFFTTKPVGVGTGLGLSVCRDILREHHGTIDLVEGSAPGATFRIVLPISVPAAAPADRDAGASPLATGASILLVDDEPEVLSTLAEILTHAGHRVETAADGVHALKRLDSRSFDVIVSDVRMPGLDGPGLYAEIERRFPSLRERIVFLTGDTMSTETREFLQRIDAVSLGKPFLVTRVIQAIQRALGRQPAGTGDDRPAGAAPRP